MQKNFFPMFYVYSYFIKGFTNELPDITGSHLDRAELLPLLNSIGYNATIR